MTKLISRNHRARYKVYLTPKQSITNLSHDCPVDLCIGNKNEQTRKVVSNKPWGLHHALRG